MPTTRRRPTAASPADIVAGVSNGALFVASFLVDVVSRAVLLLKFPVSGVLTIFLLGALLSWSRPIWQPVVTPICVLPAISTSKLCKWKPSSPRENSQKSFEHYLGDGKDPKALDHILGNVLGGGALSSDVTDTMTLVVLLRVSDLNRKEALVAWLNDFEKDAKKAGRNVRKLSSRVVIAVETVLVYTNQALKSIADARAAYGSLAPAFWRPRPRPEAIAAETYHEVSIVLTRNFEALTIEVETSIKALRDIEDKLNSLLELLMEEASPFFLGTGLDELWLALTTHPSNKLRKSDSRFMLLREVAVYRKQSLAHVTATLRLLQRICEDIEDMRERFTTPPLLGIATQVEVLMQSVEIGLQRLKEWRTAIRFG